MLAGQHVEHVGGALRVVHRARGRRPGPRGREHLRVALRPADWAGQERVDVLLAEDRRLQRPRLGGGVKAELLVQPQAESAVDLERIVPAPERIEGEHRDAVSALAETIERDGSLRMRECSGVVELGQCRVGGLQACT